MCNVVFGPGRTDFQKSDKGGNGSDRVHKHAGFIVSHTVLVICLSIALWTTILLPFLILPNTDTV